LNGSTYLSTADIYFSSGHSYTLDNLNMSNNSLTYNYSYLLEAELAGTGYWASLGSGGASNITWSPGPMGHYASSITPLSATWHGTDPDNYSARASTRIEQVNGVVAQVEQVSNFTVNP
jgi:hypothetical protein